MYLQRHDQFAKELLVTILEPFGQVRRQVEVSPEPTYIDVVFEGLSPLLTPEEIRHIGLLGKVIAKPCLLEPYRSPLRAEHLDNAMAKVLSYNRWAARQKGPRSPPARLRRSIWVLTPTASPKLLMKRGFMPPHTHPAGPSGVLWGAGVYTLAPEWKVGLVVLDRLPETPETLLLRLLGRGETQLKAARELAALPPDHPHRTIALDLIHKWRIFEKVRHGHSPLGEPEVNMYLETAGSRLAQRLISEGRQEGRLEGRLEGRQEGRRVGELVGYITLLHELRGITQPTRDDLLTWDVPQLEVYYEQLRGQILR